MRGAGQDEVSRRRVLCGAAAGAALLAMPGPPAGFAAEATADLLALRGAALSSRIRIDLPLTFEYGLSVPLGIALDCPMTEADHVRRIDILAENNPLPDIASFHFVPGNGPARAATRFRLAKGDHRVWAFAEMSGGAVLAAFADVVAAKDGCGGNSGIEPGAPEPIPVPRVNLPGTAARGEVVDVPSMISHRMETGFRTDTKGNPLPRRIINRMECRYGGRTVFAADLAPAIAANAYLKFPLLAARSGDVDFVWFEDGGAVYRATRHIEVADMTRRDDMR